MRPDGAAALLDAPAQDLVARRYVETQDFSVAGRPTDRMLSSELVIVQFRDGLSRALLRDSAEAVVLAQSEELEAARVVCERAVESPARSRNDVRGPVR